MCCHQLLQRLEFRIPPKNHLSAELVGRSRYPEDNGLNPVNLMQPHYRSLLIDNLSTLSRVCTNHPMLAVLTVPPKTD